MSSWDEIDFEVVTAVEDSWLAVKNIPDYANVAGEILFRKIFELAPPALGMFSFGPQFAGNEEALYSSAVFQSHAQGVVRMLDEAVNMLGPDLEPVLLTLAKLGAIHTSYGVLPAHYGIVGEALLHTLETALGNKWTPKVQEGWTLVYSLVSTAMISGAEKQIQRKKQMAERRRKARRSSTSVIDQPDKPNRRNHRNKMQGIAGAVTRTKNTALTEKVATLVDDALALSAHSTMSSSSDTTTLSEDEVNYADMISSVCLTWDKVKEIPNYDEVAGVMLFKNIFKLAPAAKGLFGFTKGYEGDDDEALYSDKDFLKHATRVVRMLDAAVNMLGPDLEPVARTLESLGARHVAYGVVPEHYPVVGQALLTTLEAALGDAWTPTAQEGWKGIYSFVSATMIKGAKRQAAKTKKEPSPSPKTEVVEEEEINYAEMITSVSTTWDQVKTVPNYDEVAGVLLFKNIFKIAPEAKGLFDFTKGYDDANDEALYSDEDFLKHATRVVRMLDAAVNMLGPDLEPVSKTLEALGARHVAYGVVPEHYPVVGEALLTTLAAALGDAWTPTAQEGWKGIYSFVSATMIKGAKKKSASSTQKESAPKESADEEVQYSQMIVSVYSTWDKVRMIPNYEEVAGVLLFKKIFALAPEAKALFDFTKGYDEDNDYALYSDPQFLKHATRVVRMLDAAVNMLGPDLEPVSRTLEALGARHVSYGVLPEHYPVVGEALLSTLEIALGDEWTPTAEEGWKGIYSFVSTTMIKGSRLVETERRRSSNSKNMQSNLLASG